MEPIKIELTEIELKEFVSNKVLCTSKGILKFDEWSENLILTRKFEEDTKAIELYLNGKKINLEAVMHIFNLYKRFIMGHNSLGAQRRIAIIIRDLVELIILKSKQEEYKNV